MNIINEGAASTHDLTTTPTVFGYTLGGVGQKYNLSGVVTLGGNGNDLSGIIATVITIQVVINNTVKLPATTYSLPAGMTQVRFTYPGIIAKSGDTVNIKVHSSRNTDIAVRAIAFLCQRDTFEDASLDQLLVDTLIDILADMRKVPRVGHTHRENRIDAFPDNSDIVDIRVEAVT